MDPSNNPSKQNEIDDLSGFSAKYFTETQLAETGLTQDLDFSESLEWDQPHPANIDSSLRAQFEFGPGSTSIESNDIPSNHATPGGPKNHENLDRPAGSGLSDDFDSNRLGVPQQSGKISAINSNAPTPSLSVTGDTPQDSVLPEGQVDDYNNESDTDLQKPSAKRTRRTETNSEPKLTRDSRGGGSNSAGNSQLEIKKMTDVRSRACDECRRRKTACYYLNSDNPKCFRCQMENIDCTFSARTRPQFAGPSGGGPHRPAPIPARSMPKQLPPGLVGPVEDYSQLPGRSLLKKTLSLQHPRSSFAVGQHGLWDQRVLESIPLDKTNQARVSPNLALRQVGTDSWFMVRNEGGQADWVRDCDEIERLIYPYGRALVNAFFMYFQPEYPILHEKIFVEKYMRTYRELMPALLGAVYLIGMSWWIHSAELSTVPRPDHIMPQLYDLVLTNFFKSSGGSSLSLVQAGLLLLQCSFTDTRHLSICAVINAAALRLALNRNCLHWKLPRWEINLRVRLSWATYSQSTWISLFESVPPLIHDNSWFLAALNSDMFDRGVNEPPYNDQLFIHLNKLSLIVHDMHNLLSARLLLMYSNQASAQQALANNANVNMRVPRYGFSRDSSNQDSPLTPMQNSPISAPSVEQSPGQAAQLAQAAFVAGEPFVSESPVNQTPTPVAFTESLLELIKPLQLRLHEWYQSLPPAIVNIDGENPTGNYSLRISYIAAEVTLHRFIIRVISSQAASSLIDPNMIPILRRSAKERLDVAYRLLKALGPQHLHQFWYFVSSQQFAVIGVFAALMYTTSENSTEAEYFSSLLQKYIARIQLFSDNEVMGGALRTLRSSIAGVPGLQF